MPGAWGTGINKTGRNTATMVPNEMTSCQWTYAQGAAKGCMWKRWGLSENATLRTWTWRTSISYGQRIGIRTFQEESWVWGWTLCLHRCTQVTGAWHRWTVRKCGGGGASHVAQLVKNLPAMQETWVWPLGWEDPLGKGNGYPLQYTGLENSMDYIVHGVAKSQTQLSDFHFHFTFTSDIYGMSSLSTVLWMAATVLNEW